MSKYVNKSIDNYKKISYGSENAFDLSSFTELNAAAGRKGDLGFTDAGGTYRVVLYSNVLQLLGEPAAVKVFIGDKVAAIVPVSLNTPGAYSVMKGGIIYSADLADSLMALAPDVEFKPNCTTRCGRIDAVQENADGTQIVVISFV